MATYDLGTARGRIIIDASSLGRATSGLQTMGKSLLITGALGVGAFVGVVKSAADLEKVISSVAAVSGASAKEMDLLRETSLLLGEQSVYTSTQIAEGMLDLAKAGIGVEDIVNGAAAATINLAAAAGDELPGGISQGAEIIANAMKTFEASAEDLDHFANVLVGAAASSTINVEDLATTLKYAGPIANSLGIDFEDLAATIAILGDRGIKGSTAGTSLRGVLLSLTPTSKKATETMMDLGLITEDGTNKFYDMNGTLKPMPEVMQLLADATKDLSDQEKVAAFNSIFQRRAMNSALILAEQGAKGFHEYADAMEGLTAAEVAAKKLDNLSGDMTLLQSKVDSLIKRAGLPLQEMVRGWVQWFTKAVDWLNKLDGETLAMIVVTVGAVGAFLALVGAGLLMLSVIFKMYRAFVDLKLALALFRDVLSKSFLTNPIFLFVAALVALGLLLYLAYQRSESFRNAIDGMVDGVQELLKPFAFLVDRFKSAWRWVQLLVEMVAKGELTMATFSTIIGGMVRALTNNSTAFDVAKRVAESFYSVVATVWGWITKTAIPAAQRFAESIDWGKVLKVVGIAIFALVAPIAALVAGVVWAYQNVDWFKGALTSFGTWLQTNLFPVLQDFWNVIWEVGKVFVTIISKTGPLWKAWFRLLMTVAEVAIGFLVNLWNLFGDNIVSAIKIAWDFVKNIVEAGFKILSGVFKIFAGILQGDWSKVWEGIKSILSGAWQAVTNILKTGWRVLILVFQTAGDVIHAAWDLLWSFVKKIVPATWNFVLQLTKQILGRVVDFIKGVINRIISPFVYLYDVLVGNSIIPDLMNAMWRIFKNGLDAVVKFFKEFPGKVISALGNLVLLLVQKGKDIVVGMANGVTDRVGALLNWFGLLPQSILDKLGDLSETLLAAGKALMNGLLDGIKAAYEGVTNFVGGIADTISNLKGPLPYDRKVLIPNGEALMAGLLRGIMSGFGPVDSYMSNMASMMAAYGLTGAGLTSNVTGVGPQFNINLTFPVTEPGEEETIKSIMGEKNFLPELIRNIRSGVGGVNP